jgi:tetratricopeptide (TPR) repeat protein
MKTDQLIMDFAFQIMKFKRKCFLCFVVFMAFSVKGQSGLDDFNMAVQLGQSGKYLEALALFQQVKRSGVQSPALDYNLGTTYLQLDSIGQSILYLERALKYLPNDAQIQNNIRAARQRMQEAVIPVTPFFLSEWMKKLNGSLSLNGWAILSILFAWILSALLIAQLRKVDWRFNRFQTVFMIASITLLFFSVIMCFSAFQRINYKDSAILMAPQTELRVGPDQMSTVLGQIFEGEKLSIKNQIDEWVQVELLNRDIGWIRSETITRI